MRKITGFGDDVKVDNYRTDDPGEKIISSESIYGYGETSEAAERKRASDSEFTNKYNAQAKELFNHEVIMARVIRNVLPEFKDLELQEIEQCFIKSKTVPKDRICTVDTVSVPVGFKRVEMDLRFDMRHPRTQQKYNIRFMLVDFEIQNKHNPGYSLHKRGVYYCARMLNEQLSRTSSDADYDSLQKVCSIWVVTDAVREKCETIQTISLKDNEGHVIPECDLLSLSFVNLNLKVNILGVTNFLIFWQHYSGETKRRFSSMCQENNMRM